MQIATKEWVEYGKWKDWGRRTPLHSRYRNGALPCVTSRVPPGGVTIDVAVPRWDWSMATRAASWGWRWSLNSDRW